MIDDVFQKRQIGRYAANTKFSECAIHSGNRLHRTWSPCGDLHQQRVVIRRDDGTGIGRAAIKANTKTGRAAIGSQSAIVRCEIIFGVFGSHAALQRMAIEDDFRLRWNTCAVIVLLADSQSFRDANLCFDDIDAGHLLGDSVFDLNARIDFNKIKLTRLGIH